MYTPSQMRMLKIAVIGMGIILLLGFVAVIGRIVWLVNSAPKPPGSTSGAVTAPLASPASPLILPKGAVIRNISLSGSRLAIHYDGPEGAGIRIVDMVPGGETVTVPVTEAGK